MAYKATFFDGTSSVAHAVTIHPKSATWSISFEAPNILQDITWNVEEIKKSEAYTKGFVTFTYGHTFPFQKIESTDPNFINYINNQGNSKLTNKIDVALHTATKRSIALLLLFIVGFSCLMYFFVIPTVAVSFAKNLHKNNVIKFGDYVYNILSSDLDIDETQSEKLQDFVNTLQIDSEFPIDVKVAKNEQLNAFAISGGKVVIYSSLLDKIDNQHQLAALIGHEISHIQNRHVLKHVTRNLSGAIFVSIIFGDINSITAIIGENAHLFSQLSFSRSLEKEADIYGMELLKNNQLDMHGMPELFEILQEESTVDMPDYLSSHPMLKDRIEYTSKIANEQQTFEENTLAKQKWDILKESIRN